MSESEKIEDEPFDLDMYYATGGLPYEEAERVRQEILNEHEIKRQQELVREHEILTSPELDYYDDHPPEMPKYQIGLYVADQGIPVPLISSWDEWRVAFEENRAMLRSEMRQDYNGLSGLLDSRVINPDYVLGYSFGLVDNSNPDFKASLGRKIYEALKTGDLDPTTYMQLFAWKDIRLLREANSLGVELPHDIDLARASTWRYISGTNIRIFADPTIKGRYHLGLKSSRNAGTGLHVDPDGYDLKFMPFNGSVEFDTHKVLGFYEQVRQLPRFDQRQAPLIEIQMDNDGKLYFLQYLKTGHIIDPIEPFELPSSEAAVQATEVRGATSPEGWELKIYISPPKIREHMRGQGFFIDWLDHKQLSHQIMSIYGDVVINNSYLSLKDNHFDSSPLTRPKLGMSVQMDHPKFAKLVELAESAGSDQAVYIVARITANGRGGVIESDWDAQYEDLS